MIIFAVMLPPWFFLFLLVYKKIVDCRDHVEKLNLNVSLPDLFWIDGKMKKFLDFIILKRYDGHVSGKALLDFNLLRSLLILQVIFFFSLIIYSLIYVST